MSRDVVIGIDIGGTWTKIGFVSETGECLSQTAFRTQSIPELAFYLEAVRTHIDDLARDFDGSLNVLGVGVGAPNVNYESQAIEYPGNLNWGSITPFAAELEKALQKPVKIINDANAAALGEMRFGSAKGLSDFVVITLGTGLGCGIVSGGQVIHGHTGMAGEIGHFVVEKDGWHTVLGAEGGLEAYVSATGLKRSLMFVQAKYTYASRFRNVCFNDLHGEDITKAALEGDLLAKEAFEFVGEKLGVFLANLITVNQPELIILSGGLVKSGYLLIGPTQRVMESNLIPVLQGKVNLVKSKLVEKTASIVGASVLIWDMYKN